MRPLPDGNRPAAAGTGVPPVTTTEHGRRRRGQSAADRVGERLAAHRKHRKLKISELARMAEVSPSLIGQIERGQSQPSVATLFALAESLDVPVDAFFVRDDPLEERPEPERKPSVLAGLEIFGEESPPNFGEESPPSQRYVVRGEARSAISIDGGVVWERLTPDNLPHVDFLELAFQPGAESHRELYRHPGTEMVLVLTGELDIYVGFERYELDAGDSMYFPSALPHRYVNPTDEVARVVKVILHEAGARGGPRRARGEDEEQGRAEALTAHLRPRIH